MAKSVLNLSEVLNLEVVSLSDKNMKKAFPATTSLKIAEYFGKGHNMVLRDIRNVIDRIDKIEDEKLRGQYKFAQSSYVNEQNKKQPMYLMNEQAFIQLVMSYEGEKATEIQSMFIYEFTRMKEEQSALLTARAEGIDFRNRMTLAIAKNIKNKNQYVYSNFTNLVYKTAFGKSFKTLKAEKGIEHENKLRDCLSKEEIQLIQDIEGHISTFLEFGQDYNSIKRILEQKYLQ